MVQAKHVKNHEHRLVASGANYIPQALLCLLLEWHDLVDLFEDNF